jgi:uncharacterized protein YodC (DUF2158 family)
MLQKIKRILFGMESKFKEGDSVQIAERDQIMIVEHVVCARDYKEPIIVCKWYDQRSKETVRSLYMESRLTAFDWYQGSPDNILKGNKPSLQTVEPA